MTLLDRYFVRKKVVYTLVIVIKLPQLCLYIATCIPLYGTKINSALFKFSFKSTDLLHTPSRTGVTGVCK